MTTPAPIEVVWTGDALRPVNQTWAHRAARAFVQGAIYRVVDEPERSAKSHNHFFACVEEAWRNLPEDLADRWPTSEHLRRYALIRAGFCDTQSMPCPSHAAALRFAAFTRPIDEFALVTVSESVVTVYRAKSQSMKAMGKQDFQRSKEAVLAILADLIEVSPKQLARAGEAA